MNLTKMIGISVIALASTILGACGGGGSGGGGSSGNTYKYKVTGSTNSSFALSTDAGFTAMATNFTLSWNEVFGVVGGVYVANGETITVSGTSNNTGRTITIPYTATGVTSLRVTLPVADSGTVTVSIQPLNGVATVGQAIVINDAVAAVVEVASTAPTMPALTCGSGAASAPASIATNILLTLTSEGESIKVCMKSDNSITSPDDTDIAGTFTYARSNSNLYAATVIAKFNGEIAKVALNLCFATALTGTAAMTIVDSGISQTLSGTFSAAEADSNCVAIP